MFYKFIIILLLAFGSQQLSADTVIITNVWLAGNKKDGLAVVAERKQNIVTEMELIKFYFYKTSNSKIINRKSLCPFGPTFISNTIISRGKFMKNARYQLFVFFQMGSTEGIIYDFNGDSVNIIYDTDRYNGPRIWDRCFENKGISYIEEKWTPDGFSEPGFSLYKKNENVVIRVLKWDAGKWLPVRFYLKNEMPILL